MHGIVQKAVLRHCSARAEAIPHRRLRPRQLLQALSGAATDLLPVCEVRQRLVDGARIRAEPTSPCTYPFCARRIHPPGAACFFCYSLSTPSSASFSASYILHLLRQFVEQAASELVKVTD